MMYLDSVVIIFTLRETKVTYFPTFYLFVSLCVHPAWKREAINYVSTYWAVDLLASASLIEAPYLNQFSCKLKNIRNGEIRK